VEIYSPREIARAAGISESDVLMALGDAREYVPEHEALRIARQLLQATRTAPPFEPAPLFSARFADTATLTSNLRGVPLALSSTLHAALVALAILITAGLTPTAATSTGADVSAEPMRLVFLATPGPGGGGGGGGLLQKPKAPKALREGHRAISSPLPERQPPKEIVATPEPKEPKPDPPLKAEQLPAVIAPIVTAPADNRTRIGVLEQTTADSDSHGAGRGGGAGTGTGTGLGEGEGSGVGPGSGGGTGGGPYRPGSGIEPPKLLREVKADYTEEARQRGVSGEVVLEIVVRRDGTVGDARVLQGLAGGLNDRAVQAVRQWRFSPARRLGTPVDVIVEVSVEFRLR
jgi:TonB family protein